MDEVADKQRLDSDFTELYRAHLRDVYSYSYYRVGNHHDAEDLTEQTFLQAYRHFERARRGWIFRPVRVDIRCGQALTYPRVEKESKRLSD